MRTCPDASLLLCAEVVCQGCNNTSGITFMTHLCRKQCTMLPQRHQLSETACRCVPCSPPQKLTSTSTDTLLPLIGTAAVVKIFTMIDNLSNRHGESFKTVKNIHFFLCQNMAQNHVGVTAFSTNNCP